MKFTVPVRMYQEIEVEVDDEYVKTYEEARNKAIDMAYDHDWNQEYHWYKSADENGVFED